MTDKAPKLVVGFTLEPEAGGARLVAPDGARHYLNPTAAVVCLCCDGRHDPADIAAVLQAEFGLDKPPEADVIAALADLVRIGAVQPGSGG